MMGVCHSPYHNSNTRNGSGHNNAKNPRIGDSKTSHSKSNNSSLYQTSVINYHRNKLDNRLKKTPTASTDNKNNKTTTTPFDCTSFCYYKSPSKKNNFGGCIIDYETDASACCDCVTLLLSLEDNHPLIPSLIKNVHMERSKARAHLSQISNSPSNIIRHLQQTKSVRSVVT